MDKTSWTTFLGLYTKNLVTHIVLIHALGKTSHHTSILISVMHLITMTAILEPDKDSLEYNQGISMCVSYSGEPVACRGGVDGTGPRALPKVIFRGN